MEDKELIEMIRKSQTPLGNKLLEWIMSEYVKSINSEATVETPSVNDNEQKGKICNAPEDDGCYCKEVDMGCLQCKFYH